MQYLKLSEAFALIELMVVTAILAILMAVAVPNFISYRDKTFCTRAETDASHVAAAIADYFGNGNRINTPEVKDLNTMVQNHVKIIGSAPNINITIQVTDTANRCPLSYQNSHSGWDSNYVFTKLIH